MRLKIKKIFSLETTFHSSFSTLHDVAPQRGAFTLLELLIVIAIIAMMASLALPHLFSALLKGEMLQTLSNERQLYLAAQAMAIDANTSGTATIGWPGDMSSPSFSAWASALCNGYLSTSDFSKCCSAPGVVVASDKIPTTPHETALTFYPVQENSDGNAIFLITRNATPQGSGSALSLILDSRTKPYGNKGCVVMHRAGDAVVIMPNQVTNSASIGSLATNATTPLE